MPSNSDKSYSHDKQGSEISGEHNIVEEGGKKDPKPLPYLFEKELINNRNKRIYVVDDFGPSRNIHHLTSKFYARHEQSIPENHTAYRSFVDRPEITKHCTQNQYYGWMPSAIKAPQLLSKLNFINAPKQRCYLTVYGEALHCNVVTERPVFNGLRFQLQ